MRLLRETPQGSLNLDAIDALRVMVGRLGRDDRRWIDTDETQRVLGVTSSITVPTLVQAGLLRGRVSADACLEVRLVDVLHERLVREGLLAIGGDELTQDELRAFGGMQPVRDAGVREEHTSS